MILPKALTQIIHGFSLRKVKTPIRKSEAFEDQTLEQGGKRSCFLLKELSPNFDWENN